MVGLGRRERERAEGAAFPVSLMSFRVRLSKDKSKMWKAFLDSLVNWSFYFLRREYGKRGNGLSISLVPEKAKEATNFSCEAAFRWGGVSVIS